MLSFHWESFKGDYNKEFSTFVGFVLTFKISKELRKALDMLKLQLYKLKFKKLPLSKDIGLNNSLRPLSS